MTTCAYVARAIAEAAAERLAEMRVADEAEVESHVGDGPALAYSRRVRM